MIGRRQRLTPELAQQALREGQCLYAPVSPCSGPPRVTGLRHEDDDASVLACRAHYGRLRKLNTRRLDELHRHLSTAFGYSQATPARDEHGVVVV